MKDKAQDIQKSINEAGKQEKNMSHEEIKQHLEMDARYRSMQTFEFETYIRQQVDKCVTPIREG